MTRVLVLGATGHIGTAFARACRERGLEVTGASRRGGDGCEVLDARDPASFGRLSVHDVIINATDSSQVPPVPMARHCLEHGGIFIETSAEADVFRALLRLEVDRPRGSVVAGAGAFPGLSTYLLTHATDEPSLTFVASWSVLSAAGPGTVQVMLDGLTQEGLHVEAGAVETAPPLARRDPVDIDGRRMWAIGLGMPDVVLALHPHPRRSVEFLAAVRPALPGFVLRFAAALARRGVFAWRPVQWALRAGLTWLRGTVLRAVASPLTIELRAGDRILGGFRAADAFRAGARSVAVLAERWPRSVTGVALPMAGVPLETMAAELAEDVRFYDRTGDGHP